ncbi:MAG: hypothetical protein ACOCTT_00055 [archaeon]
MKRGIATWLMTKVVMLIFLTMTFAVILSFTGLVQQRAVADSSQHLVLRVKDSIQALLGIRAETGTRFVVMPEEIPEDSDRSIPYTMHIWTESSDEVYIAIAEDLHSPGKDIDSYIAASSFTFEDYEIELGEDDNGEDNLILNSSAYGIVYVRKEGNLFRIYGGRRN